ncbi:occludin isoform X2 [Protopterus annectens]|uniref:occludin isoform X2 n=1 Tax=Protopterus annectens TaxID=7888 RepID=UPI001CFA0E26|nr:occludin isoform X2 [Protopterus annectens]
MSSRPFESPPPYDHGSVHYSQPASYAPSGKLYKAGSRDLYNEDMQSQPAYSYYPGDEVQHFYKWSSPPGVIKILAMLVIVMCIGIFACVASTLPWDLDSYSGAGIGTGMSGIGYGGSYSGMGSYLNYGYGYGYGGNYINPRSAKGFILAMAAMCFIFTMILFIILISKGQSFRTRKFYLIILIACAVLGSLMLIATIVYVVAVNPTAQAAGSSFYYQIVSLCSQFYVPAASGVYTNQYLYHYCVVEPQEAIAIVLGFFVVACLAIIIFFAVKVRRAIGCYGKMNILWDKDCTEEEANPNVEEWVKNVSGVPSEIREIDSYPDKVNGSINYPMHNDDIEDRAQLHSRANGKTPVHESEIPLMKNYPPPTHNYSSSSDATAKKPVQSRPPRKRKAGREKSPNSEGYDTDYTTGAESCDELDDDDLDRTFPRITSEQQRQTYKQEFDSGLQEYKQLQAAMDDVNKRLSDINSQLDLLHEDSEEYQALAEEYNMLKDRKLTHDFHHGYDS